MGCDTTTIQGAIDISMDGDTIDVAAGTYTEDLDVYVNNLTIIGPNVGLHGTDGSRSAEATVDGFDILIPAIGVTIDGMDLKPTKGNNVGALPPTASGFTLTNCIVEGNIYPGSSADDLEVSNNLYQNTSTASNAVAQNAIYADGAGAGFNNWFIDNNTFTNVRDAINLSGSSGTSWGDIIITNNIIEPNSRGINSAFTPVHGDITITNNTITTNDPARESINIRFDSYAMGVDLVVEDNTLNTLGPVDFRIHHEPTLLNGVVPGAPGNAAANLISAQTVAETAIMWDDLLYNSNGHLLVLDGMSIQAAIDAANPGDTIQVAPGDYVEDPDFTGTSQLVILGPNAGTSGCDYTREPEAVIQGTVTISTGAALDFLHFDGFRIESDSVDGIVDLRLESGGIYNNVLAGNWVAGPDLDISGITTEGASVEQNWEIVGNKITGYFRGLNLRADAELNDAFILENCFSGNSIASFSNSTFHLGTPNIRFERNDIQDNNRGVRFASGHFEFTENNLVNNGAFGIRIGTDNPLDNVLIENNAIVQHDLAIRTDNNSVPTTNVVVSNNDLSGNDLAIDTEIDYIANCNWFGTDDIDSIEMDLVTGSGTVYVRPYLIEGTDTQPGQTGFFPDPDNCQNPDIVYNITQNSSFSSIQTAIDLANPGDVIQVGTGTFVESIVIDKEGLTLQNGSWPVIDGGGNSTPVHITANNVTIQGFKVTNADPDSALIWIDNVTGTTIDSNYLTNPGDVSLYGIAIDGGSDHSIIQNTIDSVGYGIALQNSTENEIGEMGFGNEIIAHPYPSDTAVIPTGILLFGSNENTISDNEIFSVRYGIHLADQSDGNSIGFNRVEGQDHGIIFRTFNFPMPAAYSAQNNQILSNEIIATDSSFKYGIKLQDSANMNTVSGNNIHTGWGGIWVEESSDIGIVNNFISTTEYGIRLQIGAENVNINDNSITGQPDQQGLENSSGDSTDATCNWWGSASLSEVEDALNPMDVDFAPYLYSGVDYDSDVSTGFQPEPLACTFQLECPQDTTLVGSSAPGCNTMVGGLIATSNDPEATLFNDFQPSGMGNASDTYPFGETVVTFTAESALGDSLSCTTTVTVQEEVTLACVAADTIYLDVDCEALLPDYTDSVFVEVVDGCDTVYTITQNISAGTNLSAAGFLTVEVTAENATFGNSDTCEINVAVLDTIPPDISCNLILGFTVSLNDSCEATIPTFDAPAFYTLAPNCDTLITFSQDPVQGTIIDGVGMTPVSLSVTDQAGNSSSCTFNFITVDLIPPTVTCPSPNDTIYVDQNCDAVVPDYIMETSVMDNCSPPSVTQSPAPQNLLSAGIHTVRIDIEDDGGNTDSCFVEVTVLDTIPPMVQCTTVVLTLDSMCEAQIPDFVAEGYLTFSDNCTADSNLVISPTFSVEAPPFGLGVDTITFTVTDESDNTGSCDMVIERIDVDPPTIECSDSLIVRAVDTNCNYIVEDLTFNASVSDNCDTAAVVSQSILEGDTLFGVSTHAVVLTAEDASGNSATCSFVLELEDNIPPVIDCPSSLDTIYVDIECDSSV
ncbi:MAG: HYR domain-containing protein, partial [Saprospirales bacterium]